MTSQCASCRKMYKIAFSDFSLNCKVDLSPNDNVVCNQFCSYFVDLKMSIFETFLVLMNRCDKLFIRLRQIFLFLKMLQLYLCL